MNRTIELLKVAFLGVIAALLIMNYVQDEPRANTLRYSLEIIGTEGPIGITITDRQTGVMKLFSAGGELLRTISFEQE